MSGAAGCFRPGAFGENLVVEGAREAGICLGDQWRLGGVLLEVSQGRQPCWQLNLRFGVPDMARRAQDTGRAGGYCRGVKPGTVAPGSEARLTARPNPGWSLARGGRVLYRDTLDVQAFSELAAMPGLPESWRRLAQRQIDTSAVEGWRARTETPR
jgi:MOSC domain-containing protein YiiM